MSKVYLSNAFSLNMIDMPALVIVRPMELEWVKDLLEKGFESAVGHQATAEILSNLLKIDVPVNRTTIKLQPPDLLIVFQLSVRLQEGQVLNSKEILDLYSQGKASFILVEVES